MPRFCSSAWMNAPMAYFTIGPILSLTCAKRAGGKCASNHGL